MDYSSSMKKNLFPKTSCICGAAFLLALTGCVGYVRGPGAGVYVGPAVEVNAGFAMEDDYIYYPGYQMYYGSRSHRWYDYESSRWMSRPAPRYLSPRVIRASPSVRVDFHDSPAAHHAQVIQTYPRNWRPDDRNSEHSNGRRDDHQR